MTNLTRRRKRKKRLRPWVKFILFMIIIVGFSLSSYGGYLYSKINTMFADAFEDDGREKSDLRETAVDITKDNISILLIGTDTSDSVDKQSNTRSDTLILATLNKKDNSIKLLSIPRDTYAYIPSLGYKTKINHAFANGGVPSTIETVENLLHVPVDYFVTLNFESFIDIVDALGGITVHVPYELQEQNSHREEGTIHLRPGMQNLDGEEALALARTRKYDNDIERGKRQVEIIKAVADKASSFNSLLKYDEIIETIGDHMKTNLVTDEIRGLISYGLNSKDLTIESLSLEGEDYQPSDTYYYKLDEESLANTNRILRSHLGLEVQKTIESNEYAKPMESYDQNPDNTSQPMEAYETDDDSDDYIYFNSTTN